MAAKFGFNYPITEVSQSMIQKTNRIFKVALLKWAVVHWC